jgi:hypothetical protein
LSTSRVKAENAGERLNSLAKVIEGWRKVLQATEALSGWSKVEEAGETWTSRWKVEQIGNLEKEKQG